MRPVGRLRCFICAECAYLGFAYIMFNVWGYSAFLGMGCIVIQVLIIACVYFCILHPLKMFEDMIDYFMEEERAEEELDNVRETIPYAGEVKGLVDRYSSRKTRRNSAEIFDKQTELTALQSQINPHFLYNTLDTLYWMAIVEEQENIAQLTRALSDVFRISLNQGKELLSICEELKFIDDYLYIQNIRFDGKFMTRIQVDKQVYDWKIIKLIIQPFVENAIYHGLEPKMNPGSLNILGWVEEQFLVITIEDDGVGMDTTADMQKGYAMQNVMNRVRIHYGRNARMEVESEAGYGTKVTLYLPVEKIKADTENGN